MAGELMQWKWDFGFLRYSDLWSVYKDQMTSCTTFGRSAILFIVYWYKVDPEGGAYVDLADKALREAGAAIFQGSYLVDDLPSLSVTPNFSKVARICELCVAFCKDSMVCKHPSKHFGDGEYVPCIPEPCRKARSNVPFVMALVLVASGAAVQVSLYFSFAVTDNVWARHPLPFKCKFTLRFGAVDDIIDQLADSGVHGSAAVNRDYTRLWLRSRHRLATMRQTIKRS
ncbi:hypothetical protein BDZ89DRAFT_1114894 [Hymenopellis radicata]|nr:hypothetical protein BDZ89DRAFT_1114894 [Hymenopellis radicata]